MSEKPIEYRYGQHLTWAPSKRRSQRLRVKVVGITGKRIIVNVIEPGWDHSRKYYLREAWLLPDVEPSSSELAA